MKQLPYELEDVVSCMMKLSAEVERTGNDLVDINALDLTEKEILVFEHYFADTSGGIQ